MSDLPGREAQEVGYAAFFGLPPFAPLARAAAVFAADVALPPFRPSETAAGFLRGMAFRVAVDVPLGQGLHASHRQGGDLGGQGLERGDVASRQCGIAAGHQVASRGVHVQDNTEPLGFCQVW
jgi:hypothetical protein